MHSSSLVTDIGRVAGLIVLLLIVGGLVAAYADSLRRGGGHIDPTVSAAIRARIEQLRGGRR
jgi:hypothetical protein